MYGFYFCKNDTNVNIMAKTLAISNSNDLNLKLNFAIAIKFCH